MRVPVAGTSSPAFGVISDLDFGPFNRYKVVSNCCFNFHVSDNIGCGVSFPVHIFHVYMFFGGVSITVSGPSFNQVVFLLLIFKSSLYMLENSILPAMSFTDISS